MQKNFSRRSSRFCSGNRTLFHISINDIFLFLQKFELANYAHDSPMCSSDKNIDNTMTSLNHDFAILSNWFYKNFMVFNLDKCSFFCYLALRMNFKQFLYLTTLLLQIAKKKKVLGITFDNKLEFPPHLTSITKKATIKLNALTWVQKYILQTPEQKTFLTSSFIKSQFN